MTVCPISLVWQVSRFACTIKQLAAHPHPHPHPMHLLSLDISKLDHHPLQLGVVIVVIWKCKCCLASGIAVK